VPRPTKLLRLERRGEIHNRLRRRGRQLTTESRGSQAPTVGFVGVVRTRDEVLTRAVVGIMAAIAVRRMTAAIAVRRMTGAIAVRRMTGAIAVRRMTAAIVCPRLTLNSSTRIGVRARSHEAVAVAVAGGGGRNAKRAGAIQSLRELLGRGVVEINARKIDQVA